MKLERQKRRSGGDLILEMTPLIDVVFLLLIFFMLATTFDERAAFKIDLPKTTIQKTKQTLKNIQIFIDVEKNITLKYLNGNRSEQEKVTITTLENILSEKLNNSSSKEVIISADKSIDYGYIVEIMGMVKISGAEAINIDTTTVSKR